MNLLASEKQSSFRKKQMSGRNRNQKSARGPEGYKSNIRNVLKENAEKILWFSYKLESTNSQQLDNNTKKQKFHMNRYNMQLCNRHTFNNI